MRKILLSITILSTLLTCSCSRENDLLIMGKQQIFLDYPLDGATFAPSYGGDRLSFKWHSLRHFADNEYVFSTTPELTNPVTLVCGCTYQQTFLLGSQIDSVAAVLGFPPEEQALLYWQIRTVDPEQGWCEEVRQLKFVRLGQVTMQILGQTPAASSKFYCEKSGKKDLVFSWGCDKKIYDYTLWLSDDREFEADNTISFELGEATSYSINEIKFDALLETWGYDIARKVDVFWKVTGSGDAWNPVEESPRRTVKARRVAPPAVNLTYTSPADNAEIELASITGPVEFSWSADTTNVNYTLKLYDAEFDKSYSFNCGTNNSFSIAADELDSALQTGFGMVPGQKKKFSWSLTATPEEAVILPENPNTVIITRK